jgi:hypothetical protein
MAGWAAKKNANGVDLQICGSETHTTAGQETGATEEDTASRVGWATAIQGPVAATT